MEPKPFALFGKAELAVCDWLDLGFDFLTFRLD